MKHVRLLLDERLKSYENDLVDLVKAYGFCIVLDENGKDISLRQTDTADGFETVGTFDGKKYVRNDYFAEKDDELLFKRFSKRFAKVTLYEVLKDVSGVELPWGSLTGIRPTSLLNELKKGQDGEKIFREVFGVSESKCKIASDILENQQGLRDRDENAVDLYVNIPFCVSRCAYCSFISAIISDKKRWIAPYLDSLNREFDSAMRIIATNGYKVKSVYVGGGTPTSLCEEDFAKFMQMMGRVEKLNVSEFTVEAGRPDTITENKLIAMKSAGVNRISINPQTFKDETLELIGRKHKSEDIIKAFELARSLGFDNVNMDLIAALPGETLEDFENSLIRTVALSPENITVHTLALKRSSTLSDTGFENRKSRDARDMIDFSTAYLYGHGYRPYYLYRQKNMNDNLENTGYCKPGKQCAYNVENMEETTSIIAIGAGGISKKVIKDCITRTSNIKNIEDYCRKTDDLIAKREEFFSK